MALHLSQDYSSGDELDIPDEKNPTLPKQTVIKDCISPRVFDAISCGRETMDRYRENQISCSSPRHMSPGTR